ncbi:JAB domain-containing protein [Rufibacter tibetensis]|uniref:JAB domain-containing protein n=1 Tax=Rufibacter tibetensis TaxID=512763 RepID=UPI002934A033|nr:JAB domain-containing protein [Rufibacter tibetensis]
MTYRSKVKASPRAKITCSEDTYDLLLKNWDPGKLELVEHFKVLLLNRAKQVLGTYELSSGGIAGTVADPKLIFVSTIKACASGVILCHNHPSGNRQPSPADIQLTKKVKEGGALLNIAILDHIILTSGGTSPWQTKGSCSPFFVIWEIKGKQLSAILSHCPKCTCPHCFCSVLFKRAKG